MLPNRMRIYLLLIGVIVVAAIGASSFIKTSPERAWYRSVSPLDLPSYIPTQTVFIDAEHVNGRDLPGRPNGEYVVYNEKLLLKVSGEWGAPFTMKTKHYHWSQERLNAICAQHPELKQYLPDPSRQGGGVKWLEVTKK